MPNPHHYIVIEGPLGVGKTSLAHMLAENVHAHLILEDVEENPFLVNFYKNPKKHAFQTQVYFLLRRYQQAQDIRQMGLFNRTIVSDYLFDKDRVFARANLDDNEFWLYEQMFHLLKKRVSPPDLVIFLQASTDILMERIKMRDRKYERSISFRYLDRINQSFNDYFFHYTDSPLLVVDASRIDFVHVPEDFKDLVDQIKRMKSGVQYYIPLSTKT
jgi:deoxyadenosine/deoxycytidine kinase